MHHAAIWLRRPQLWALPLIVLFNRHPIAAIILLVGEPMNEPRSAKDQAPTQKVQLLSDVSYHLGTPGPQPPNQGMFNDRVL